MSWLPRKAARIGSVEAEADALIDGFGGAAAYKEARRRESESSSDAIAEDWGKVALAVARKTGAGNEFGHQRPALVGARDRLLSAGRQRFRMRLARVRRGLLRRAD